MEKKITNVDQFEKLVEELQRNPSLAVGFQKGTTPSNFKQKWEEIAVELNSLGPPRRLGDGWQKVWRDLKFKVKKKLVANKAEFNATGGGLYKQFSLSPLEESVANLLQFRKQLNPEGRVQGIPSQEKIIEDERDEIDIFLSDMERPEMPQSSAADLPFDKEQPSCSNNHVRQHSTPKRSTPSRSHKTKKICNGRDELLEKHSDQQAKILTEISNTLSSVKRYVKDVCRYQQNMIKIEKRKLELLEEKNIRDIERNKREEEMHNAEIQIKKIKMIIKEKELQLLNKSSK